MEAPTYLLPSLHFFANFKRYHYMDEIGSSDLSLSFLAFFLQIVPFVTSWMNREHDEEQLVIYITMTEQTYESSLIETVFKREFHQVLGFSSYSLSHHLLSVHFSVLCLIAAWHYHHIIITAQNCAESKPIWFTWSITISFFCISTLKAVAFFCAFSCSGIPHKGATWTVGFV